jgi:hypothetical protein
MNRMSWGLVLGALIASVPAGLANDKTHQPDLSQIKDGKTWTILNAECETVKEDGKSAVRLKPKGEVAKGSNVGLALVEGLEFAEGTIELDLKGKGKFQASFVGVAFNVADEKNFEAIYFRPFNFLRDPESFRVHSVQYVSWPNSPWEKLRKDTPGKFESTVEPVPDPAGWFHARIEVTQKKVSVWVDDGKEPCLVVDRLATREKGKVGLWVDSKEGEFRNLKIQSAK